MGIHRLLHHMQDFGSPVELGTSWQSNTSSSPTGDFAKKYLVVDGPSLAYHAYHRAVAGRYHARNALEAVPSHGEIAAIAADFLTTLEAHNIHVVAIFFDGGLPATKRATRLQRLHSSCVQLQAFKTLHPDEVRCVRSKIETNAFHGPTSVPEKLLALPATPFLVPAVIDHLCKSAFSDRTFVIPGEADIFCADVVNRVSHKKECWLLSSDTDLLVFDLGPSGSVLRFQDVSLATFPRRTVLKGIEYHPKRIADRLGLRLLAPFAFSLTKDPHQKLNELIQAAKALDLSSPDYKLWLEEYTPLHGISGSNQLLFNQYRINCSVFKSSDVLRALVPEELGESAFQTVIRPQSHEMKQEAGAYLRYLKDEQLRTMDPRVSEFVNQVCSAIVTHKFTTNIQPMKIESEDCSIFLPFLIEDPTRASAWRPSVDLRYLGYCILSLPMPSLVSIEEWERRGQRIAQCAVPRLNYKKQEIIAACDELSAHITAFMVNSGDLHLTATLHFWKLYGAMYLCDKLIQNEECPASKSQVLNLYRGRQGQLNWPHIHRAAQLQGVWYSLRMLRQFLSIFLSFPVDAVYRADVHADADIQKAVAGLYERLDGLPSATKFFDPVSADDVGAIPESYLIAAIETFPGLAPDPKEEYHAAYEKRKNRKRKKAKQGQSAGEEKVDPQERMLKNRFAALNRLADDI
ncbi:XPG domain containing-domain-containing protein [Macrophomina phaseolina]|uniref:XPG domain containing-domain-containing protein n=1 Tax=Macrophomina phaseolina TaxID=35725 RepID=A0ABQ8G5Q4_9PEZI|nr:XPG domain containing-domain-containing protein [Macrophomina phaseolina]